MNEFADLPYCYYPPKPQRAWMRLLLQYNRFLYLPGKVLRINSVSMINEEQLSGWLDRGRSHILFLCNHPTHSDPQIIEEMQRQLGVISMFMAAYDLFERRSKLDVWVLQVMGVFSIDREILDSKAIKQGVKTLVDGEYAMTIFPEGEVYYQNDRVVPFQEGSIYLALIAQKKLAKLHPGRSVYIVPVSIKVSHDHDQRPAISTLLAELAAGAGTTLEREREPVVELERIASALVLREVKKVGLDLAPAGTDGLEAQLKVAAGLIIAALEKSMDFTPENSSDLMTRLLHIRRRIHQIRIDPDKAAGFPEAGKWADQAMLALRVLSYNPNYLRDRPSVDRYGECVEKLFEDFHSRTLSPYGNRKATVYFSSPINLLNKLNSFQGKSRELLKELTEESERAIQGGIDKLNDMNSSPGGELFYFK
ncbi:MAG TPA: 1-acyl-sn-glycerol-3-phosphate acyltransferase [Spirochaetales bacterium]|nr:1-acyl-sn-glycerol-3-phosphate acyltransferase [Spirochaetales bacterium]